ncbi:MAG: chondroitinase family protein [Proteobacteria bacterium]|nr:chondroitinase family protein [Pseudomonadota bacterium]
MNGAAGLLRKSLLASLGAALAVALLVRAAEQIVERPPPALPTLGKGQQVRAAGRDDPSATIVAASVEQIIGGFRTLRAGQVLEIVPGTYRLRSRVITANAGAANAPITVRAATPGSVIVEVDAAEGLAIDQPYWIVENLLLRGVCALDADCEHAIHITGQAHHAIIRNNRVEDFNAHLKINGDGSGHWPDDGALRFNTLTNTRPRQTSQPVTPFDLVGASRWVVADNVVSNFVKDQGNRISYGIFMKGGSRGGRIERNLIVCTPPGASPAGQRVGVSFGGGSTDPAYCRSEGGQGGQCAPEHQDGVASNNIVAHCNDEGIDVNRSSAIAVVHNTLIATGGIAVRNAAAAVRIYGNLLDGRIHTIRATKGGQLGVAMNEIAAMNALFVSADALDLDWRQAPATIAATALVADDFCGRARSAATLPGAFAELARCPPAPPR